MRRHFTIRTARIILISSGEIVLVQRTSDLLWELPGGRLNKGEDYEQAAKRELFEETGIRMQTQGLIYTREREIPMGGAWVKACFFLAAEWELPTGLCASDPSEIRAVNFCPIADLPRTSLTERTHETFKEAEIAQYITSVSSI